MADFPWVKIVKSAGVPVIFGLIVWSVILTITWVIAVNLIGLSTAVAFSTGFPLGAMFGLAFGGALWSQFYWPNERDD